MNGGVGGRRGVVDLNRVSDGAWGVLGERRRVIEGEDGARGDSRHIGAVVSWHVRAIGRKLRRRTGSSVCPNRKA